MTSPEGWNHAKARLPEAYVLVYGLWSAVQDFASPRGLSLGECPVQERTGRRGYLGKVGSVTESWHITKTAPRSDSISLACRQSQHSPALIWLRIVPLIL